MLELAARIVSTIGFFVLGLFFLALPGDRSFGIPVKHAIFLALATWGGAVWLWI